MVGKRTFRWRLTLRNLHRDIGYLCVGLCVVYAVSGVATNHARDWDYNYSATYKLIRLGKPAALLGDAAAGESMSPDALARGRQAELVERIIARLGRKDRPRKVFWRSSLRLALYFGEGRLDVVDYLPASGTATHRKRTPRFLLRAFNYLHLNEGRRAWTWIADGFAVLLFFLAVSGPFLVKGRRGLRGRGGLFLLLGILIPILVWLALQGRPHVEEPTRALPELRDIGGEH